MSKEEIANQKTYCRVCLAPLDQTPSGGRKIYCSKKCRTKYSKQVEKEKRHAIPVPKVTCKICGVDVPQKRIGSPKLYCSIKCKGKYQYKERKKTKTEKMKKCRVCGTEFSGSQRFYCSPRCRWQYWYRNEYGKGRHTYVCPYCLKEFKSYNNSRIYCSRTCWGLAQRIVNPPNNKGEVKSNTIEPSEIIATNSDRFEAVRLFREGYSVKAISEVLDKPEVKIQKWCQRLQTLNSCANAYEWRETFRLHASKMIHLERDAHDIVHLICARIDIRYNAYQLGEMVSASLNSNPFNGERYAFCSKGNTIIVIIHFDGKSFISTTRHRFSGQYVWPEEDFGGMIDVTEDEFNLILNENIHRVSGAPKYKNRRV